MYLVYNKKTIQKVLNLYKKEIYKFSFIGAVLTKVQKGKIYVNHKKNPSCAFVIHKFGWAQFIGKKDPNFIKLLFLKIKNIEFKQKIRFFNFNLNAQNLANIIKGKRVQYNFKKKSEYTTNSNEYKIKKITDRNFHQVSKQCKLDLNKRFWNSKRHFFLNSFGYCVQKKSKFIAACYSCANYEKQREIDIMTSEKFRNQGFAKLLASQFILECIRKGLEPKWDCYKDNFASNKLALSLGFKKVLKDYNFIIVSA